MMRRLVGRRVRRLVGTRVRGRRRRLLPEIGGAMAKMALYDPNGSKTSRTLSCYESSCKKLMEDQFPSHLDKLSDMPRFCQEFYEGKSNSSQDSPCPLSLEYFDGTHVFGSYVTDVVIYNQVLSDDKTQPVKANLTFGCASKQNVSEDQQATLVQAGVDGLLGFAQTNNSMISQLASSGKTRKIFSHCLDINKGGGIFVIGHVVDPNVKSTPLVPKKPYHYNVNMKSIQVGDDSLQVPTDLFETMIDSGTTLTYLPDAAYKALIEKIFSKHANLSLDATGNGVSFNYSGSSVDNDFPVVTFHFENSLELKVKPGEYLLPNEDKTSWFVCFLNGGRDGNMAILGDIVLSNKLVTYDLENQTIGWKEYNCSSTVKIEDEMSGNFYRVDAHDVSSSPSCPSPSPSYS